MYHAFKTPILQNSTIFFQSFVREITLGRGVGDYIFAWDTILIMTYTKEGFYFQKTIEKLH